MYVGCIAWYTNQTNEIGIEKRKKERIKKTPKKKLHNHGRKIIF
jgi:hypothetical protein